MSKPSNRVTLARSVGHAHLRLWLVMGLALALLITLAAGAQGALPAAEQDTDVTGWLNIIWGDSEPGSNIAPTETYVLTDDKGQWIEIVLDDQAQSSVSAASLNRKRVTASGQLQAGLSDSSGLPTLLARSLRVVQTEATLGAEQPSTALGSQPWVTIACKFPDVSTDVKPRSYFEGLMGPSYPGLDHYWRELSYNRMTLAGSRVVGWYTLPHPWSYYWNTGCREPYLNALANDCMAAADTDVSKLCQHQLRFQPRPRGICLRRQPLRYA
jgi:hypothetical protein